MAKRPFQRGGIFNGANPLVFARAKSLRSTMTDAETVLWNQLKTGLNGLKFRRQHPLGCYIADFYCHRVKLVIEIDGSIHSNEDVKKKDAQKENDLNGNGYTVIRFSNNEVMTNVSLVVEKLKLAITNCLNNNY
ncbi:MAG: endonuclease domain-containing protein [Chitinophagaceae bacterium]|nr:MAG: endonuclease domain-containing protein [Chitinophagaceae bacterium]